MTIRRLDRYWGDVQNVVRSGGFPGPDGGVVLWGGNGFTGSVRGPGGPARGTALSLGSVAGDDQVGPPERRSRYELHLPYTIVLRLGWGGRRGMVYFFASQPAAADRCAGYVIIGRNYNIDQPDRVIREFEDTIFGQDQIVVEAQRPERVPFDLAAELHLRFDAVAVAYRRAMRDLGLAAGSAIGSPVE